MYNTLFPKILFKFCVNKFSATVRSDDFHMPVCVVLELLDQGFDKGGGFVLVPQKFLPPFSAVVINNANGVVVPLDGHIKGTL